MVDDGVFSISLNGTRQSPINIETDKNVIETDEALDDLKFAYVPENCTQVLKHYLMNKCVLFAVQTFVFICDKKCVGGQHGGVLESGCHAGWIK